MCTDAEYRAIVDRYAATMENFEIPNGRPENARYLIYKLFSIAEKKVRLYTGKMAIYGDHNGEKIEIYGWPQLIESVVDFLQKEKTRLQIIVQDEIDGGLDGHPMLIRLRKKGLLNDKVQIKKLDHDDSLYKQGERHFLTVDNHAYRMEMKDSDIRAVANFNDPDIARTLASIFDRVFPRTIPVA